MLAFSRTNSLLFEITALFSVYSRGSCLRSRLMRWSWHCQADGSVDTHTSLWRGRCHRQVTEGETTPPSAKADSSPDKGSSKGAKRTVLLTPIKQAAWRKGFTLFLLLTQRRRFLLCKYCVLRKQKENAEGPSPCVPPVFFPCVQSVGISDESPSRIRYRISLIDRPPSDDGTL